MKRSILPFLFLYLGVASLLAHETWLAPGRFASSIGEPIDFGLTSGLKFPVLDYAIKPERVAEAQFRLAGHRSELKQLARGNSALRFGLTPAQAGLLTAWVRLKPKSLELSDVKVIEYFEEIDAPKEVRNIWARRKERVAWKETYTKCAKTILRVGDAKDDDSWKVPVGMPLEIVPLTDPTVWKVGEKVEVQLLENGKPLANIALGAIAEGGSKRDFAGTDADGRAAFLLVKPGRLLLFGIHLQSAAEVWQSTFTTLTSQVAP